MDDQTTGNSPDEAERALILAAFRKAAAEDGGRPPGEKHFRHITGISGQAWKGKHWLRWSDLVRDAGYANSARAIVRDDELMLTRLAEVVRHFGKVPSAREVHFYACRHRGFPAYATFTKRFTGHRMMFERLRKWAEGKPDVADVVRLCAEFQQAPPRRGTTMPAVYLVRAGEYFKIGWATIVEQRIRDIQSGFPEPLELIHTIVTSDPLGTEAHWHRRFAGKRVRGEWFRLTPEDVEEFRRGGQ